MYRLQRRRVSEIDPHLKRIVIDQLDVDERDVVPNASLMEDVSTDSLDLVKDLMSVEVVFKIQIPDEDAGLVPMVGETQVYLMERGVL